MRPRPDAKQTFDDIDGFRFTAFSTDQPHTVVTLLDAHRRAHDRG
jgi:hypothetical protein